LNEYADKIIFFLKKKKRETRKPSAIVDKMSVKLFREKITLFSRNNPQRRIEIYSY
jgi:hypothetical protein